MHGARPTPRDRPRRSARRPGAEAARQVEADRVAVGNVGLTQAQFVKHVREIRDNPDRYPEWAREIPVVVDSRFQDQADVLEDAL